MSTAGLARLLMACGIAAMLAWSPSARAQDVLGVTGAQIGTADDVTVVRVALDAGDVRPVVSPFRRTDPEQLVLDIAGATLAPGAAAPAGGLVTRSEFSTFNDGTDNVRLTLFLSGPATWSVSTDGGVVVVTLRPGEVRDPLAASSPDAPPDAQIRLSGPEALPVGPALTSLDFQQRDRVSRVLFGSKESEPAISQPERTLIVVDLPGAAIPQSLLRELNTRFFYSAVDSVRAYETRAGARVAIRLREGAEYTVSREGGLHVLSVTIPQDLVAQRESALQRSSAAAPSTPDTNGGQGLSNSKGAELLISGSGQTLDPQSTFGDGGGASTPGTYAFATDVAAQGVRYSGRRMSIEMQDADIHVAFRFIADFADINIVASDDVKGNVTVRLKDVPWDEALAAILQAKGLAAQQMGRIIRVAPLETIKAEQQAALESKRASDDLEELSLYIAPLNYAQADELTEQVKSLLTPRGTVQVDPRGNQLIIKDSDRSIASVRELLKRLDQPNRQVSIEARFVEANSTFTKSLGIQWGADLDASAATGYPTGAFFPNDVGASGGIALGTSSFYTREQSDSLLVDLGASSPSSGINFSLGSIPGLINIDARLSAAVSDGYGKIISAPRVTALDNEQADVIQGARIPYKSISQAGTQVQFVNAALELHVTPHITSDDTIFLDIEMKNDRPDYGTQVDGQPAISTKEINTRVLVPDGDTAVLGGVYSTSESYTEARVPGLGSIPILGWLFKKTDKSRQQNEMLVFITPHIIPLDQSE